MDKILNDALNNISVAIVLLDEKLNIVLWNEYIEQITDIPKETALNNNIYEILPTINKHYFKESINNILNNGYKMFFSAAMHNNLLKPGQDFNLKISRLQNQNFKFLLLEFTNVTSQFVRINQLKKYIDELSLLNRILKYKKNVIKKLAYYDKLTKLANRTLFYETTKKILNNAERTNSLVGLLFIDIDNFKPINDKYGHKAGDDALVAIAKFLTKCTRKGDLVARFGGDEFLVLLTNIKSIEDCNTISSRITDEKNTTLYYNGEKIKISLSVGTSLYPYDGKTIDELIHKADKAMYSVKNSRNKSTLET